MTSRVRGFTLIELLVVIAIIGILSSIVLASLNSARVKARDTQRVAEVREIAKALNAYFADNGYYPPNPVSGTIIRSSQAGFLAELVAGGYLAQIPQGPETNAYGYYNYGPSTYPQAAVIQTNLEGDTPSLTGRNGTCRPFTHAFCNNTDANRQYCLCLSH